MQRFLALLCHAENAGMRNPFLYMMLLAMIFSSCSKDSIKDFKDDPSINTIYGTWKLISRENYATNQVFYKDQNDVSRYCNNSSSCDIVLTFSRSNSTDTITGHTITNQVFGSFIFDPGFRHLDIIRFGGTKIAEPDWSDNIWDNIDDIGNYKINDQYLRLYFNSRQESLTFKKE